MPIEHSNETMETWQCVVALCRLADELDHANMKTDNADTTTQKFFRTIAKKYIRDLYSLLSKAYEPKKENDALSKPELVPHISPYSIFFPMSMTLLSIFTTNEIERYLYLCPICKKYIPLSEYTIADFQEWLFLVHKSDLKTEATIDLLKLFKQYQSSSIIYNDKIEGIEYLFNKAMLPDYMNDITKAEQEIGSFIRSNIKKKNENAHIESIQSQKMPISEISDTAMGV